MQPHFASIDAERAGTQKDVPTPIYNGPRFGVVRAEQASTGRQLYRAAIFGAEGEILKLSDKRLPYGECFEHAHKWSKTLGRND